MRIALVASHYPPNFVSGGTLVPQRIADALVARGHEVHVFAGAQDPKEPDLQSWTETTATGVVVHWITLTGFIGWDDSRNFDNPAMAAAFRRFLGEVRPEVVHLHIPQGFGGDLVSLAKASNAATVITMHDLWWWCSRQFQATRDMQACNPVVDCGICPCEVDNRWLRQRNDRLAVHLDAADLVLAPSSAMVDRLIANGVSPDKVAVDENPAPDGLRTGEITRRVRDDGTVRFLFAGGSHPLKGGHLAVEAAHELADLEGWSLDLYGYRPTENELLPGGTGASPRPGEPIRLRPKYTSNRTQEVLAEYDVLLLPSVASESYSLITREALSTGLVVVTSDTPGPVEVIEEDVNGLVVRRGDAHALSVAMRALVTDRERLDRLRPDPTSVKLRTLDEQVADLERRYAELVARATTPPPAATTRPIQRVLLATGIGSAPLRYRGHLAAEALATVGVHMDVHYYRDVEVPTKARTADAVVFYRVPASDQILDVIAMVRDRPDPVPILFDIDDLVFDPGLAHEIDPILAKVPGVNVDVYWQGVRRYRTTMEACDAYIGSTQRLVDHVAELTGMPTHRFANGVGRELARVSEYELTRERLPGRVRIGYFSGTDTHNEDWAFIEPAVVQVLRDRPEVELWIGGLLQVSSALDEFADRITRLPFRPWYELPGVLRDVDVNLAPLVPGKTFNDAKSAIKWLEAALVGTPTIATSTQPFREAIEHGLTGYLVESADEWRQAMTELVDSAELRTDVGHRARQQVLIELSPQAQGHRYKAILESVRDSVARDGHRDLFGSWTPERVSEPWVLQAADPYERIDLGSRSPMAAGPRALRRIVQDYRINATALLRTHGVAPTARKAVRVVGSLPGRALSRRRTR